MPALTDLNTLLCEDIERKASRRPSGISHLRYFLTRELEYVLAHRPLTPLGRANIERELASR